MASLNFIQVESSNIKAIAFNGKIGAIILEFTNGNFYSYTPCTKGLWEELMEVSTSKGSVGSWANKNLIKNEKVTYKKI